MGMLAMDSRVILDASGSGAETLSVHRQTGVRFNYSGVVVEISDRMGTVDTLASLPAAS